MKAKNKNNWFRRLCMWLTYYRVELSLREQYIVGRCVNCDANEDCKTLFDCPCKPNEYLKSY